MSHENASKRTLTKTAGFKTIDHARELPMRKKPPQSASFKDQHRQSISGGADFIQLDNLQMVKGNEQFSEYFPNEETANTYYLTQGRGQGWATTSTSGKKDARRKSKPAAAPLPGV